MTQSRRDCFPDEIILEKREAACRNRNAAKAKKLSSREMESSISEGKSIFSESSDEEENEEIIDTQQREITEKEESV